MAAMARVTEREREGGGGEGEVDRRMFTCVSLSLSFPIII